MSNMYEYDPKLKQYRRKRLDSAAATSTRLSSPTTESISAGSDGSLVDDLVPDHERYAPPRKPGLTVGKVFFWLVFACLFCGWAYFMYSFFMEDFRKEQNALKAVSEENRDFNRLLQQSPKISIDDVDVDGEDLDDASRSGTRPAGLQEKPLDSNFLEPDKDLPEIELRTTPAEPPAPLGDR
jgi:hypothetical protein